MKLYTCPMCSGEGCSAYSRAAVDGRDRCNGSGEVSKEQYDRVTKTMKCPDCGGGGECHTSHAWTCHTCDGRGKVTPFVHAEYKRRK